MRTTRAVPQSLWDDRAALGRPQCCVGGDRSEGTLRRRPPAHDALTGLRPALPPFGRLRASSRKDIPRASALPGHGFLRRHRRRCGRRLRRGLMAPPGLCIPVVHPEPRTHFLRGFAQPIRTREGTRYEGTAGAVGRMRRPSAVNCGSAPGHDSPAASGRRRRRGSQETRLGWGPGIPRLPRRCPSHHAGSSSVALG
jgi:hypothetical protein